MASPPVLYVFIQDGRLQRRLYQELWAALYSAVRDLEETRATPIAIRRGTQVLHDAQAITAIWQACREELTTKPWQIPQRVLAAGA